MIGEHGAAYSATNSTACSESIQWINNIESNMQSEFASFAVISSRNHFFPSWEIYNELQLVTTLIEGIFNGPISCLRLYRFNNTPIGVLVLMNRRRDRFFVACNQDP